MAKERQISTNQLAAMIKRGFDGVDQRFLDLEERMNKRFDRIENILLRAHENRLDNLEDFMRQAKTLLKIK